MLKNNTNEVENFSVRKAEIQDVENIHNLIGPYIETNILLNRTIDKIEKDIPLTWVAVNKQNEIIGSAALLFFSKTLCEIRALAVKKENISKGAGRALVKEIIRHVSENYERPIKVFALTYAVDFFKKLSFKEVPKENFPDKIYEVCSICVKKEHCDEKAVEIVIN
ncbi:MAG: GNAT family N-acetyltransferase [Spirochaetia bacterium]|nr:GNAT family N-acetyltransferase [Spirochaetia bacterium]